MGVGPSDEKMLWTQCHGLEGAVSMYDVLYRRHGFFLLS